MDVLASAVTPFASPWTERLFTALGTLEHSILLVSPYIKDDVLRAIERELAKFKGEYLLSIRVLTRGRRDDLLAGSSDLSALERVLAWPTAYPSWNVELRACKNLHAKVWVLDEQVAFIGSGNITGPGLEGNLEYGVELRDPPTIDRILADWRDPWEQATPVTSAVLASFRRALDTLNADNALRDAQRELDRRRAELSKSVNAPSDLGGDFPIAKSGLLSGPESPSPQPASVRASGYADPAPDETPNDTANETAVAGFVLEMNLEHVLKALRWVIPSVDGADDFVPLLSLFSALKITCERVDLDPRTKFGRTTFPSQLRLTWADRTREIEATLVAFIIDSEAVDEPVRGPWAVTLGYDAIQRLAGMLFSYQDQVPSESHVALTLRLAIEPPYTRLSMEVWRAALAGERFEEYADETLLEAPLTMDVTPAPWDEGFRDITGPAVTAWVSGREFDHALQSLSSLATSLGAQASIQRGADSLVELWLDLFNTTLKLKLAGSQGATEHVVPLYNLKGGSAPAFRVDRQMLLQMACFRGVAGDEQVWTICIPSHAQYIEFEPKYPLYSDGFISLTRWRCRLRNVE